MKLMPRLRAFAPSSAWPLAATVLTAAIFIADTTTKLEIAVPVFYTAVILMSVRFCSRTGVIFVCLGCIALTIVSDLLTPDSGISKAGSINTVISVLAMVATTYLVIKIKAVEKAESDTRAQLAHTSRIVALGELTSSIAHEVNQPIVATVINGNAGLRWLAAEPPNLDEARTTLERIVRDASRAGEIVGRIRALAKRGPMQKVPCDVNTVIRDVFILTASEIEKHHIALHTDINNDIGPINADPVQLQQAVLNLVLNAIEAMDETSEATRLLFIGSAKDNARHAVIEVRDSGKGLGISKSEQVFDAFYTTKSTGMGLGLTITRSIIEAHGGRIWAETGNFRGVTFRFTLPVAQQEM